MRNLSFILTSFQVLIENACYISRRAISTGNTLLPQKSIRKLYLVFALLSISFYTQAQVGIGTTLPNSTAALHIDGMGKKGIIIPVVSDTLNLRMDRLGVDTIRNAKGLMVFVENEGRYYVWDSAKWQCVNPFVTNSASGTIAIANPYTTITGNFEGTAKLNGDFTGPTNSEFNGYGSTPVGGIIMWSGDKNSIPSGWAICDGFWYNPDNNTQKNATQNATCTKQTPDLRGRFIVGYVNDHTYGATNDPEYTSGTNNAISDLYNNIGAPNGAASVILNSNQLPTHNHDVFDYGHNHANGAYQYLLRANGTQTTDGADNSATEPNIIEKGAILPATTGISLRQTGGNYTYTEIPNPPHYISGCTVWRYTCTTNYGVSFQSSANLMTATDYGSGSYQTLYGTDESGYQICIPNSSGYCGIGMSEVSIGASFRVTGCTENTNYDNTYPNNCVSENWDSRVATGVPIRINESWTVQAHENRPPYYVLAFIMRIR